MHVELKPATQPEAISAKAVNSANRSGNIDDSWQIFCY